MNVNGSPRCLSNGFVAAILLSALLSLAISLTGCQQQPDSSQSANGSSIQATDSGSSNDSGPGSDSENGPETATENPDPSSGDIISLFDGTFKDWETGVYGSDSEECTIEDGCLVLESGYPLAGVASFREDLPTVNYEISLECKKMVGNDFFCGLTFPVDDSFCTFIAGGWGGATTGLSCIDGEDASTNETKSFQRYDNDVWYQVRVRVTPEKIVVMVDDKQVVDFERDGHELSLRNESFACKPLGLASFETRTAFRNILLKRIATE